MMNPDSPVPAAETCKHCGDSIRTATPGATAPPAAFGWVHEHTRGPWCAAVTIAEPATRN